ncbi:MAG: cyclopropane-fatty-acyl-phospholipid synthase family protein [bacterium]|nr:cyclopropane-fatty-acyl-phospholipid synthase family protein [bacterium]
MTSSLLVSPTSRRSRRRPSGPVRLAVGTHAAVGRRDPVAPDCGDSGAAVAAHATLWQRFLRGRVHARLATLTSGALEIHDFAGSAVLGNRDGEFGCQTVTVHDAAFYSQLASAGAIGAGEAFVDGQWSTSDLLAVMRLLVRDRDVMLGVDRSWLSLPRRTLQRVGHRLRRNSRRGSRRNIADHYDLREDLFELFLDPTMTYSAAWFAHPEQSLEDAQHEKLRRLCALVDLQESDRLLEIGSGWGSLAMAAARDFGARVTTTTISENQFRTASKRVVENGLGDGVELLQRDYRDLTGTFDKLLSCEMIEAVGADFLPDYLRTCAARLRPGGVLGLQAITIADQHYESARRHVDYIKRHVFPGSFIPSVTAITSAATEHTDLRLTKLEDFGEHYAETLARWRQVWEARAEDVRALGGDDRLLRAWSFYFAYCEAGFRERHISVCHLRFERA